MVTLGVLQLATAIPHVLPQVQLLQVVLLVQQAEQSPIATVQDLFQSMMKRITLLLEAVIQQRLREPVIFIALSMRLLQKIQMET